MQPEAEELKKAIFKDLVDLLIRLGVTLFLLVVCARIFEPFMGLVLWAGILAVALYPLHAWIAGRLWGKKGLAAAVVVLSGLLVIGVPSVLISLKFAEQVANVHEKFKKNEIAIPQPSPAVAEWPLVGKQISSAWSQAARDLPKFLDKFRPQAGDFIAGSLKKATSVAGSVFTFFGSLIIAGFLMAYGESSSRSMLRIVCRFAGWDRGAHIHSLSTATIRSVAMGVIGVALLQSILLGVGFIWAGVPGAGILAVLVLLLGIAQIPAAIIAFPVIAYLWIAGGDSTINNAMYTAYILIAGGVDNVLKPLLLGRGVDAPMPIIILGALGGMVTSGIIGLFIGAVIFAIGYEVFMAWVAQGDQVLDEQGIIASRPE